MKANPFVIIDAILMDWASPKVRRLVHSLVMLAMAIAGIWLAAEGDWREAVLAFATAIYSGANRANTGADEYPFMERDGEYPSDSGISLVGDDALYFEQELPLDEEDAW